MDPNPCIGNFVQFVIHLIRWISRNFEKKDYTEQFSPTIVNIWIAIKLKISQCEAKKTNLYSFYGSGSVY